MTSVHRRYAAAPDPIHSMPTLLVIHDNLMVGLNDCVLIVKYALYSERAQGCPEGYMPEDGCFVDGRYRNLQGLTLAVRIQPSRGRRLPVRGGAHPLLSTVCRRMRAMTRLGRARGVRF